MGVSGRGWCEYSNVEPGTDPEFLDAEKVYRGVCSSHICDLKANDDVLITGPTGAEMLLPDDPKSNIIMLATGTGIAPFRSFLRKLFHDEEWKAMKSEFPDNFKYDYAVSDEMKTPEGKKMWVQHKVMEYKDEVWNMLKDPSTHTYMCGLKGMESGLQEAFEDKAAADGLEWKEFVTSMKKAHRYHVEVY